MDRRAFVESVYADVTARLRAERTPEQNAAYDATADPPDRGPHAPADFKFKHTPGVFDPDATECRILGLTPED